MAPSRMETDRCPFVHMNSSEEIEYKGDPMHPGEFGCAIANEPVAREDLLYYFEIRVIDGGATGYET